MSNLKLWNSVEKTDPLLTKPAKVGGQDRKSLGAQQKKKFITEAFGIYGISWGPIAGSESMERINYPDGTVILQYMATAFFIYNGERGTFPIAAAIKEAYVTNGGKGYLKIDDEAVKKVRTDALTKGFTDLGFNADIYMGKHDDYEYLREVSEEFKIENASDKDQAKAEQIKALFEDTNKVIDQMKEATTMSMLEGLFKAMARRIGDKDKSLLIALTKAKDVAKERLNEAL
jgi:hypothetical protein